MSNRVSFTNMVWGSVMVLVQDKMTDDSSTPSQNVSRLLTSLLFLSLLSHNSININNNDSEMVGMVALHLPADYPFNLGVFLVLLLPEPPLAVVQPVLVLQEDLIGLLLLAQQPPLVVLQLLVGHHQAFLQRVDLVLVLLHLESTGGGNQGGEEEHTWREGEKLAVFWGPSEIGTVDTFMERYLDDWIESYGK